MNKLEDKLPDSSADPLQNQSIKHNSQPELPPGPIPNSIPPHMVAQMLAAQGNLFPFPGVQAIPLTPFQQQQASVRVWQGQYPPPEAVEHYEKLLPGTFNRLMTMTEQLQSAQITEAQQIQMHTKNDIKRGQILGFLTTLLAMAGAAYCANIGAIVVACGFLGVPVMAVASKLVESAKKETPSDIVKAMSQDKKNSP